MIPALVGTASIVRCTEPVVVLPVAQYDALVGRIADLEAALRRAGASEASLGAPGVPCTACGGQGFQVEATVVARCCGRGIASCCDNPVPEEVQEQVACALCNGTRLAPVAAGNAHRAEGLWAKVERAAARVPSWVFTPAPRAPEVDDHAPF